MKRAAPEEPVTFRVFPRPSRRGLYVLVRVFRTSDQMRAALRRETGTRHHRHTIGVCQGHEIRDGRTWCLSPHFATVNLARTHLGVGAISHEFGHAMFRWGERRHLAKREGMDLEEELLYGLTAMLRQFVDRASDLGLYG